MRSRPQQTVSHVANASAIAASVRSAGSGNCSENSIACTAGYVGLWPATFESHFTPAIEVGWRLARRFWGAGLAPEAAQATLDDGFQRLGVDEIVSFTSALNLNSRRVMEKLGMRHDPTDDFDHPALAVGDPLRPHVLYRLAAPQATR